MISKKLETELNKQLNLEFSSAHLYLSMSSFCAQQNLDGFANWTKVQFEEEQAHAQKIFQYILDRGGKVTLSGVEEPKNTWKDIIEVFKDILSHEEKVTTAFNNLINVAISEKDHATATMLQWFINEQVEEEASVKKLLAELQLIEGKGAGLFMLDREAKLRVFTPIQPI